MTDWSEQFDDASRVTRPSGRDRDNVVDALVRLERSERDAVEGLRTAICGFVGSLRAEGASQEQVVEAVRTLVASPATADGALNLAPAVREALVELAIHWCVDQWDNSASGDSHTW
jgi:hypothetical protein